MRKLFILAIVLHCSVMMIFAANRYVRQGAAGNGSGNDWTNAYSSLPATLVRGDTYYIADGTYGAYEFKTNNSGTSMIYVKKAIAADHGTDIGWNTGYGDGEALFQSSGIVWQIGPGTGYYSISGQRGTGNTAGSYGFRLYSTAARSAAFGKLLAANTSGLASQTGGNSHVYLSYIDFDWNNGTALGAYCNWAMEFRTAIANDNFEITNCYAHHSAGAAFFFENFTNVKIDHCYFEANGGANSQHYETFWIRFGTGFTFSNNVVKDGLSGTMTGWLMLGGVTGGSVRGNVFFCSSPTSGAYSAGGNGIIATWTADENRNSNISIINNTFVDMPAGSRFYFEHSTGADANVVVKNNLFYTGAWSFAGVTTHSHDAFGGGVAGSGSNAQTGITTAVFTDYAGDNFHLAAATQAGDAGVGSEYNTDPDGTARGADGVWDRGAYEYTAQNIRIAENQNTGSHPSLPNPMRTRQLREYMKTNENISVYDMAGKQLTAESITRPEIYLVKSIAGNAWFKVITVE